MHICAYTYLFLRRKESSASVIALWERKENYVFWDSRVRKTKQRLKIQTIAFSMKSTFYHPYPAIKMKKDSVQL